MNNKVKLFSTWLMLFVMGVAISSCSKDKDSEPAIGNYLGKWVVVSYSWVNKVDGTVVDSGNGMDGGTTFTFYKNGVWAFGQDDDYEEGTYIETSNGLILDPGTVDATVVTFEKITEREMILRMQSSYDEEDGYRESIATYNCVRVN